MLGLCHFFRLRQVLRGVDVEKRVGAGFVKVDAVQGIAVGEFQYLSLVFGYEKVLQLIGQGNGPNAKYGVNAI